MGDGRGMSKKVCFPPFCATGELTIPVNYDKLCTEQPL